MIELMIVVVIIAIIAAIAIPNYRQSVRKANRTEAKTTLSIAAQLLEKCFTEVGSYTTTKGCPDDATLLAAGTITSGMYTIASQRTDSNFTITATTAAGQVDDTGCKKFTISSTGAKASYNSVDALNTFGTCW